MPSRGRPRLDIRSSPYLAASAFALAIETRFRSRLNLRTGKNAPLSRRAAMQIAALAMQGEPITLDPKVEEYGRADGKDGVRFYSRSFTHSARSVVGTVPAVQAIRRVIEAAKLTPADHELLNDLQFEVLAIMLDRDAVGAWCRIDAALGDAAPAFRTQIERLVAAFAKL